MTVSDQQTLDGVRYSILLAMTKEGNDAEFDRILDELLEDHRHVTLTADRDVSTWWFPSNGSYRTEVVSEHNEHVVKPIVSKDRKSAALAHYKALKKVLKGSVGL